MIQNSQYYTDCVYSKLLVDEIDIKRPKLVLDLGVGKGSLIQAAFNKWSEADFIAIDIDKSNCDEIQRKQPNARILHINGLIPQLNENIKIGIGSVDVAVCNPPYEKFKKNVFLNSLFDAANLPNCKVVKSITTDIVFLANNLSMLKNNGYLGIIIPDGIATRKDLQILRQDIIENHTLRHVIQLPDKIFYKTEARTYILILTKGKSNKKRVKISAADENGNCIDTIMVPKELLIERMDYNFHKYMNSNNKCQIGNCTKIDLEIYRGSLSFKELRNLDLPCFHTTHYKNNDGYFNDNTYNEKWRVAHSGDILLARVGKRCIGNVLKVETGCVVISDCVYRIRTSVQYQNYLYEYLLSSRFKEWVNVFSHGVCSLVISKCDLMKHLQDILAEYE